MQLFLSAPWIDWVNLKGILGKCPSVHSILKIEAVISSLNSQIPKKSSKIPNKFTKNLRIPKEFPKNSQDFENIQKLQFCARVPDKMRMLCISIIEIAHRRTYMQWLWISMENWVRAFLQLFEIQLNVVKYICSDH